MIAMKADAAAIQARLPQGWVLEPYRENDLRGNSLRGANVLVPFHQVYATDGQPEGMQQLSYVAFVSQARCRLTDEIAHIHWFAYTEDPAGVPGRYRDAKLADIRRFQSFTHASRGRTEVYEQFNAKAEAGTVHLSLTYRQGDSTIWLCADEPNLQLVAANDTKQVRWYQEDQVLDLVRSDPLDINNVTEVNLIVQGELGDVFTTETEVVGVVIQKPYMRRVWEPVNGSGDQVLS
jgi:hypothetical protein